MSVKVTYGEKTHEFEPTDKVSKVGDKLKIKQHSQTQWLINDIPVEKLFNMSSTLQSLGIKENDLVTIIPQTQKKQDNPDDDLTIPMAQQPTNPFPIQPGNPFSPQEIKDLQNINPEPKPKPNPLYEQKPQISLSNSTIQIPKFQLGRILVPQKPVKSNKPNQKLPDMALKQIYGYDVRILDKGCKVEISKPNHEFFAVLSVENTKQEESLKVKFSPNEAHDEPDFSLRLGSRELGGTKVVFLRGGQGCGIKWHNGLQTKLQFWQDE